MDEFTATASAPLTNAIGLHARPSVKLTKLAKSFASQIEIAPTLDGPWVDAKSIVKVMAVKAAQGTTLHFRAKGPDARAALTALRDLVTLNFLGDEADLGQDAPGNAHG
jgi:phosphocarrier protein HPr